MPVYPMNVRPLIVRQGTTKSAFLPTDLPGLVAWYDASRITGLSDGAAVATWSDLSGNGYDLTQGTAGMRPIYKVSIINGRPVVRFDGVDDALETAASALSLSQPLTIGLVVVFRNTLAGNPTPFDAVSATRITTWVDGTDQHSYYAGTTRTITSPLAVLAATYIINIVANGASSTFRRNGTQIDTGNIGAQGFPDIRVGDNQTSDAPFNGDIAEGWVYSGALSATQQQQLETYAASKYGVTL